MTIFACKTLSCLPFLCQIAFAHDSTRVLQCFIQFGSDEQRQEVFNELKGCSSHQCNETELMWRDCLFTGVFSFLEHIVELSKSKYARNIVKKFLMYG